LGHKIYIRLKDNFTTYAQLRGGAEQYSSLRIFNPEFIRANVDITDLTARNALLNEIMPTWIINCVGLTTRKISPTEGSRVIRVNSLLPHELSEWCLQNNSRLFHFSTDCVFSGEKGGYSESDTPDARDLYGRSKLLGEIDECPSALTIRGSIIGREIAHYTELLEWFLAQKGKSARGFTKVFYSGVTTNYMADLVFKIVQMPQPPSGLYHLASPRISKFELLSKINSAFDLGIELTPDESKAADKSLIGNRLFQRIENVDKPSWDKMISDLVRENDLYRR